MVTIGPRKKVAKKQCIAVLQAIWITVAYIYPTDSVEIQRWSSASASFFVMMRRSFDDAEEDLQRFLGSPVIDAKSMRKNSRKCILK